jgi:hypothetical protein
VVEDVDVLEIVVEDVEDVEESWSTRGGGRGGGPPTSR